jgi:hypothetical protein
MRIWHRLTKYRGRRHRLAPIPPLSELDVRISRIHLQRRAGEPRVQKHRRDEDEFRSTWNKVVR